MVMAWMIEKSLRCPDCNTYYEEWDTTGSGHLHAYFPKSTYCMGCKAKQDAYDAVRSNDDKGSITNGLQMLLNRNEEATPIRSPVTGKPIYQYQKAPTSPTSNI